MTATIELEEIEIYAFHGCYEEEQRVGNKFIVNISLDVECSKASETDNINDALNYVEVYNIVKEEMSIKSHLLEHVTRRIIERIRLTFDSQQLQKVKVKVSKMAPPVGGQMKCVTLTLAG
jgi:dihydroneopterin aldolase